MVFARIAQLEYELANFDSVVHRFNQYTTRTPPIIIISSSSSSSGTYNLVFYTVAFHYCSNFILVLFFISFSFIH